MTTSKEKEKVALTSKEEAAKKIIDGFAEMIDGLVKSLEKWDALLAAGEVEKVQKDMKYFKVMISLAVLQGLMGESNQ